MKEMLKKLKLRLFGIKPKSSGEDMIPRGTVGTIVPESFDKKVVWDRDKFNNIEIIKD